MRKPNKCFKLYESVPKITLHDKVHWITEPSLIKHAPDNTNPETMEEFMKVCVELYELTVEVKPKRLGNYYHSYRCLFKCQDEALKHYTKLKNLREQYNQEQAQIESTLTTEEEQELNEYMSSFE